MIGNLLKTPNTKGNYRRTAGKNFSTTLPRRFNDTLPKLKGTSACRQRRRMRQRPSILRNPTPQGVEMLLAPCWLPNWSLPNGIFFLDFVRSPSIKIDFSRSVCGVPKKIRYPNWRKLRNNPRFFKKFCERQKKNIFPRKPWIMI